MMPDDWEGHPLRKDYPVQLRKDAQTYMPLQVTAEEFRANMERDRTCARVPSRPGGTMSETPAGVSIGITLARAAAAHERLRPPASRPSSRRPGRVKTALADGQSVLVFGNGGSAADAQHFAANWWGVTRRIGPGVRAVALTTDTSALTAAANDYGFDRCSRGRSRRLGVRATWRWASRRAAHRPTWCAALEAAARARAW
jgi:hypothetical protein